MNASLRAELRKLRYTRSLLAVPVVAVLVSAAATTVLMTWIEPTDISDRLSTHGPLRFGPTNIGLVLLIFGVRVFADEVQHGTLTPTLLAAPHRHRLLASKAIVCVGVAIATCTAVWAAVLPISAAGVAGRDLEMTVDLGATAALFGRGLAAMVLLCLLGVAFAAAVRNRTVALVAGIVWVALAEAVVGGLLRIREYLPASAVRSLVAGGAPDLGALSSAAVLTCWTMTAYAAAVIALRRDVV
jgi:ABC-2 type transport system permease protein